MTAHVLQLLGKRQAEVKSKVQRRTSSIGTTSLGRHLTKEEAAHAAGGVAPSSLGAASIAATDTESVAWHREMLQDPVTTSYLLGGGVPPREAKRKRAARAPSKGKRREGVAVAEEDVAAGAEQQLTPMMDVETSALYRDMLHDPMTSYLLGVVLRGGEAAAKRSGKGEEDAAVVVDDAEAAGMAPFPFPSRQQRAPATDAEIAAWRRDMLHDPLTNYLLGVLAKGDPLLPAREQKGEAVAMPDVAEEVEAKRFPFPTRGARTEEERDLRLLSC